MSEAYSAINKTHDYRVQKVMTIFVFGWKNGNQRQFLNDTG